MGRAGCIAAVAGLLSGCLSSPPGGDDAGAADAREVADAGPVLVEEMNVPSNCTVLTSEKSLAQGVVYRLAVEGTISLGAEANSDSEYFWYLAMPETIGDSSAGVDFGLAVDDIVIDDVRTPDWGAYRSDHQYEVDFIGQGGPINAQFHDNDCGNNGGYFHLEILEPPG